MRNISEYINEKLVLNKNSKRKVEPKYFPKTREELKELLPKLLEERGPNADLNDVDVSEITDMRHMFSFNHTIKNIDISQWNVSKVTTMDCMFYDCKYFNCDLSSWDVSNVRRMVRMFKDCAKFNSDLSGWNTENLEDAEYMFEKCKSFTYVLEDWDVSKLSNMKGMFNGCNKNLPNKPSWYKRNN